MANLIIFPASLARSIAQTIASAAVGGKGQAGCAALAGAIGSPYRLRVRNGASTIVDLVFQNAMTATGGSITLPAYTTLSALVDGTIGSGWVVRIGKADDSVYVEGAVGNAASSAPFKLSANPDDNKGFAVGTLTLRFDPAIDASTSGVTTLAQAYATAMTSLSDFAPGNAGGQSSFENSTWPRSSDFQTSPYGANVDPIKSGQDEPGVGTTDAGYIVQRRGASSRIGNRFGLWQWIMPPKGHLNTLGNWRVQVRDVQAALKIDALSNAWRSKFTGQIRTYGANGANPLMISGLLDNFNNTNGRGLFTSTNLVDGRIEASGGISFKNFSHTTADLQVELNSNDPLVTLAADETPTRVVAFAAVYWARIIPDTGSGPLPSGIRIGAMHGVDFFDGTGRVGTPGQSRLIQLDGTWRPCFVGYVLQGAPPSQPMTPANAGAWFAANPPPFN